jgi:hypothetical protein
MKCLKKNKKIKSFLGHNVPLTHYGMSILWKMAVFIERSPVTSANYKNCFNTNQTWHKCWLDHWLCNNMLLLKSPVTMATRGHLKIAKNHYFALIFFHQNWFQSAATSQWIEIESNAFQHWLHDTLWST